MYNPVYYFADIILHSISETKINNKSILLNAQRFFQLKSKCKYQIYSCVQHYTRLGFFTFI